MKGDDQMGRKNISVLAQFTESGTVMPRTLIWEDGRCFAIDRVLDVRKMASTKGGGFGTRFMCRIRGREVYFFREEDIWFMEVEDR